jgi:RNA polymerase sigma-70 factor (ECF subfamily)
VSPSQPETSTLPSASAAESASLLDRAWAGDPEAFCELCRDHEARLFRQAVALSGNPTTAEDLAQETLLAAWKGIRRFRGQCRFFTWICGILINVHRNSLRQRRPVGFSSLPGAGREEARRLLAEGADPGVSPQDLVQLAEREAALRACLARLPRKHRDVVYLRFYVDASLDSIAAALDCSLGTVKSRLFHALEKLAQMPELKRIKDTP